MKRNPAQLANQKYDVLIIGGGIYGVFAAWDAALRGLSVAMVEKGDFGHATSSNTLRIIHGGLRYLQHGDIRRMRQSIRERKILLRIAQHLVQPLPFVVPTYGHRMRGKEIFSLALLMNDFIGFDRNHQQDPQKHIPRGRIISKDEILRLFPGSERKGLNGGAVFYDGQMANSERLILAVARSAVKAGADLANYVEVTGLLEKKNRVVGVTAEDVLTGEKLEVRAGIVVNATGPWLDRVLCFQNRYIPKRKLKLSKAFNLVVNRQLTSHRAVGVYSKSRFNDRDAVFGKSSRLFFITPWYHRSLIGTAHLPYDGDLDNFKVTDAEIQAFLNEVNAAYPAAELKRQDVTFIYWGLLPAVAYGSTNVQLTKRHRIHDHGTEGGLDGLISVQGVKFTEARHVAEKVVDLVCKKLGKTPVDSTTAITPVHGAKIEQLSVFVAQEARRKFRGLNALITQDLIGRYGSEYPSVLKYLDDDFLPTRAISTTSCPEVFHPRLGEEGAHEDLLEHEDRQKVVGNSLESLTKAEVLHGIREEMAHKLSDVIFRRTILGIAGDPGDSLLRACAAIMAKEFGWDVGRTQSEVEEVRAIFAARA